MATLSGTDRKIAKFTASQFAQEGPLYPYYNEDETRSVNLMTGFDCPIENVNSYATVGLSSSQSDYFGKQVRVELVGACASKTELFANVISSVAIDHLNTGNPLIYGNVFENILGQYDISNSLKHIVLCSPFLWKGMTKQCFEDREVHWLMVVPISHSELKYWQESGYQKLIDTFERAKIDVYDINRPSAL